MTLKDVIFLAIGIVIGASVAIFIDGQEIDPETIAVSASCDDSKRYTQVVSEGFSIINPEERDSLVKQFNASRTVIDPITGQAHSPFNYGFISKKALDNIFSSNLSANGVNCYIGMEGNDLKLMISPGSCPEVNGPVIPAGSNATYLVRSYCPTMCY
jgi:hypothetical protein